MYPNTPPQKILNTHVVTYLFKYPNKYTFSLKKTLPLKMSLYPHSKVSIKSLEKNSVCNNCLCFFAFVLANSITTYYYVLYTTYTRHFWLIYCIFHWTFLHLCLIVLWRTHSVRICRDEKRKTESIITNKNWKQRLSKRE